MNEPIPAWQLTVFAVVGVASLAVWAAALVRWWKTGAVLAYEQRRPAPWGAGVGCLAVFLVALNLAALTVPRGAVDRAAAPGTTATAERSAEDAMVSAVVQVLLVVIVGACLMLAGGARLSDLGLPSSGRQLVADLGLGVLTVMAALAPAYAVQFAIVSLLGWQTTHPTIQQILANPTMPVVLAAYAAAAIGAPVFEESLFRLLFQGWFEKFEDEQLPWPEAESGQRGPAEQDDASSEAPAEPDETAANNPYASPRSAGGAPSMALDRAPVDEQTRRGFISLGGLPHGWPAILASSALFSLAHLGLGPSPLPLFVFAILLGYVYQRTHRIVPCLVAHMGFNTFSLTTVFLSSGGG